MLIRFDVSATRALSESVKMERRSKDSAWVMSTSRSGQKRNLSTTKYNATDRAPVLSGCHQTVLDHRWGHRQSSHGVPPISRSCSDRTMDGHNSPARCSPIAARRANRQLKRRLLHTRGDVPQESIQFLPLFRTYWDGIHPINVAESNPFFKCQRSYASPSSKSANAATNPTGPSFRTVFKRNELC